MKKEFPFPSNPISEEQHKKNLTETRNQIYGLLKFIQRNLNYEHASRKANSLYVPDPNNVAICGGVMTYAIEEFGKLLLLKECTIKDGLVDLSPIKKRFFNHEEKYAIAKSHLGKDCIVLYDAYQDNLMWMNVFDEFYEWERDTEANFDTRLNIFNVGFESDGRVIPSVKIDFDVLNRSAENLYNVLLETNV